MFSVYFVTFAFCKLGQFAFLSLPLRYLGKTYAVHFGLIGNRVVDFLLVLIELFSLGVTAEHIICYFTIVYLMMIIDAIWK